MFDVECEVCKDQLYGVFGASYYGKTGLDLPYNDPETAYEKILKAFGWPEMCIYRTWDGDATGVDGYLTPPKWRGVEEKPRTRECQLIWHIPQDYADKCKLHGQFRHGFHLAYPIQIWSYKRNHQEWWAYGYNGRAIICVEKTTENPKRNEAVAWLLRNYLEYLGNRDGFRPVRNCWAFGNTFLELLNQIDQQRHSLFKVQQYSTSLL